MKCKVCGGPTELKRDSRGWSKGCYRTTCSDPCLLKLASISARLSRPDFRPVFGPPSPCGVCGAPTPRYGRNAAYRKTCSSAC